MHCSRHQLGFCVHYSTLPIKKKKKNVYYSYFSGTIPITHSYCFYPISNLKAGRQVVQWHYHMGRSHTYVSTTCYGGNLTKLYTNFFFFQIILHFLQNTFTTNEVRGCHIRNHNSYTYINAYMEVLQHG